MSIFVTKGDTGKISLNVAGVFHTTTIDITRERALELASEIVGLASGGIGNSYEDVMSGLKNGDQGFDDTDKLKAEVARYKGLYQEMVTANEVLEVRDPFDLDDLYKIMNLRPDQVTVMPTKKTKVAK